MFRQKVLSMYSLVKGGLSYWRLSFTRAFLRECLKIEQYLKWTKFGVEITIFGGIWQRVNSRNLISWNCIAWRKQIFSRFRCWKIIVSSDYVLLTNIRRLIKVTYETQNHFITSSFYEHTRLYNYLERMHLYIWKIYFCKELCNIFVK